MVSNLLGRKAPGENAEKPQSENVNWLPRSRLRAGGRGDFLLTALMVATVSVLAVAAGFAAWSRHEGSGSQGGELSASSSTTPDKGPDRASVARAPTVPAASPPAPVRNASATPQAPASPPADVRAPTAAPAAVAVAPTTTVRIDSSGAPITPAAAPQTVRAEPPTDIAPLPSSQQQPVAPAPVPRFSASAFEAPPPLAGVADWAPPPAPPAAAPVRSEPTAPRDLTRAAPAPERAAASSPAPAPQRTAALTPPPAPGARVSVYLDEYPDQKAAAAALSQKSGAYGKAIGSGGKLTYTRRNGDSWRLRVGNLDQAAAEAMCVRLRNAGAPCSIGPN